jgi:hypothetical protein
MRLSEEDVYVSAHGHWCQLSDIAYTKLSSTRAIALLTYQGQATSTITASRSQMYLQSSRVIIVVGEIKRLTSDSAFRHHYLEAHRRKHNGSVILVATKSDVRQSTPCYKGQQADLSGYQ